MPEADFKVPCRTKYMVSKKCSFSDFKASKYLLLYLPPIIQPRYVRWTGKIEKSDAQKKSCDSQKSATLYDNKPE